MFEASEVETKLRPERQPLDEVNFSKNGIEKPVVERLAEFLLVDDALGVLDV